MGERGDGGDVPGAVRFCHDRSDGFHFHFLLRYLIPCHVVVRFDTKQSLLPKGLHNDVDLRFLLGGGQGVQIHAPLIVIRGGYPGNGQFYDPTCSSDGTRCSERIDGQRLHDGNGFDGFHLPVDLAISGSPSLCDLAVGTAAEVETREIEVVVLAEELGDLGLGTELLPTRTAMETRER